MISEVENIDCMARLCEAPDNFWDLAIVDPPFGINAGEMRMNNNNHTLKPWDSIKPPPQYWTELERVSRNQIIWGMNYFFENFLPTKCFVVWDKKQPEGVSFAMAELAWTSFDSTSKVFYQFPSHVTQGDKIHPCQKPIELYRWLLQNYASPGDKILDTHMGSQSSRIAAYDLGFAYSGFELDADYFKTGCERFETHRAQGKLFSPVLTIETQEALFA